MIESISIASTASYGTVPEVLDGLSQHNFIFGSNATGKTTISRVIADETTQPACKLSWKGGTKLQTMVYNHDFVERNFNQSAELKGVFTLGEKHVETLGKIVTAKVELDGFTQKIESLTKGLQGEDGTGGKRGELAALETGLKEKCWAQKQKHDAKLQGAFEGYRGSAEKFKAKVLVEWTSNSATLLTLSELEKKAETAFGPTPTSEQTVPAIDTAKILAHESNPILKKRVIGKEDVDIAAMIKKLGNSDWVRNGRSFYEVNEMVCPFCQQETTEEFAKSLNEYFDEAFEADSKAIDDLVTNYNTDAARLQQQVAGIIASPSKFLDLEKLKAERRCLIPSLRLTSRKSSKKRKSQVMLLSSNPSAMSSGQLKH